MDLEMIGAAVIIVLTNIGTFWLARRTGIVEGFLNHTQPAVRKVLERAGLNVEWHRNRIAEEQRRKNGDDQGMASMEHRRAAASQGMSNPRVAP